MTDTTRAKLKRVNRDRRILLRVVSNNTRALRDIREQSRNTISFRVYVLSFVLSVATGLGIKAVQDLPAGFLSHAFADSPEEK